MGNCSSCIEDYDPNNAHDSVQMLDSTNVRSYDGMSYNRRGSQYHQSTPDVAAHALAKRLSATNVTIPVRQSVLQIHVNPPTVEDRRKVRDPLPIGGISSEGSSQTSGTPTDMSTDNYASSATASAVASLKSHTPATPIFTAAPARTIIQIAAPPAQVEAVRITPMDTPTPAVSTSAIPTAALPSVSDSTVEVAAPARPSVSAPSTTVTSNYESLTSSMLPGSMMDSESHALSTRHSADHLTNTHTTPHKSSDAGSVAPAVQVVAASTNNTIADADRPKTPCSTDGALTDHQPTAVPTPASPTLNKQQRRVTHRAFSMDDDAVAKFTKTDAAHLPQIVVTTGPTSSGQLSPTTENRALASDKSPLQKRRTARLTHNADSPHFVPPTPTQPHLRHMSQPDISADIPLRHRATSDPARQSANSSPVQRTVTMLHHQQHSYDGPLPTDDLTTRPQQVDKAAAHDTPEPTSHDRSAPSALAAEGHALSSHVRSASVITHNIPATSLSIPPATSHLRTSTTISSHVSTNAVLGIANEQERISFVEHLAAEGRKAKAKLDAEQKAQEAEQAASPNKDKLPGDMMTLMMGATRKSAFGGTDKQSLAKQAALSRPADEILPFLWLGAYHNVWADVGPGRTAKHKELTKANFTQILTVAEECQLLWPKDFSYMKIPIFDLPTEDISKYFEVCIDFIDRARYEDGKVMVHCWVGASRSASIVIAYLMARCDMRLFEAYDWVKKRRPIICPNKSFWKALERLDKDLYPDFLTGQYTTAG